MTPEDYTHWLAKARAISRRADEAEDLLQECLLIAFKEHRLNLEDEDNRRWLTGVMKNQSALAARSAVRRKQREETAGAPQEMTKPESVEQNAANLPDALPPAARKVALLALHGLNRTEIRYALKISDDALRQRLTTIRKTLGTLAEPLRQEALALAYWRHGPDIADREFGLIRRALLHSVRQTPGVGTHDPDGHLLVIGEKAASHIRPSRQR